MGNIFAAIRNGASEGLDIRKQVDFFPKFKENVDNLKSDLGMGNFMPEIFWWTQEEMPQRDIMDIIFSKSMGDDEIDPNDLLPTVFLNMRFIGELWYAFHKATIQNIPIASAITSTFKELDINFKELEKQHTAYSICQFILREEGLIAPTVETIDDALRLREDPRIHRFRDVLDQWCAAISEGQENLLNRIHVDIIKANKEMKKLKKWKNAQHILSWASIPCNFIPFLGQLLSISILGCDIYSSIKSRKYSWVGLGQIF